MNIIIYFNKEKSTEYILKELYGNNNVEKTHNMYQSSIIILKGAIQFIVGNQNIQC